MKIIIAGSPEHQELINRATHYNDGYILEQLKAAEQAGAKTLITLGSFQDAVKHANGTGDYEIITNPDLFDFIHKKR